MKYSISNVHEIAVQCNKKNIPKEEVVNKNLGSIYVSNINKKFEPRRSYIPMNLKNSVMHVARNMGFAQMRKSQINIRNTRVSMTKSQLTRNVI